MPEPGSISVSVLRRQASYPTSYVTVSCDTLWQLIDVIRAAAEVVDYENQPSRSSLSKLREALEPFDFAGMPDA